MRNAGIAILLALLVASPDLAGASWLKDFFGVDRPKKNTKPVPRAKVLPSLCTKPVASKPTPPTLDNFPAGSKIIREDGKRYIGRVVKGKREGRFQISGVATAEGRRRIKLVLEGKYASGKKTGVWQAYESGRYLYSRCDYQHDEKHGTCIYFDRCQNEIGRRAYQRGELHGPSLVYHDTGVKKEEAQYARGKSDGKWQAWHRNGERAELGEYRDGRKIGKWQQWFDNGLPKLEVIYGSPAEAYEIKWHNNGKKRMEFRAGVKTQWYPDGSMQERTVVAANKTKRWYKSGKLESVREPGMQTSYYETGKIKSEVVHATAEQHGSKTYFHDNGKKMLHLLTDKSGQPVGEIKRWDSKGKPISPEEWKKKASKRQAKMKAIADVLEIPLSVLIYGLK